jgi:hypothetical protein
MTDERLGTLRVAYDDALGRLTIAERGERGLEADLRTSAGRAAVEQFFEAFMGAELSGRPRLVSAPGHMFTDNPAKYVSLINLASVAEVEGRMGGGSTRYAFAPISTSRTCRPGPSSIGWGASWPRVMRASRSPSGSIAVRQPTSIRPAVCAT